MEEAQYFTLRYAHSYKIYRTKIGETYGGLTEAADNGLNSPFVRDDSYLLMRA